jgi:hypothetical protein
MKTISLNRIKIPKITAPNKIAMSKADSITGLTVVFRILIGKTGEILNLNSAKSSLWRAEESRNGWRSKTVTVSL